MLRRELVQAARTHLYPRGLRVEFRPIVEDGLFGFELDTDASAATYVVIGQTTHGQPVVRLSRYRGDTQTFRLATCDGVALSPTLIVRKRGHHEEQCCKSWKIAAEHAWAALARAFPGNRAHQVVINTMA